MISLKSFAISCQHNNEYDDGIFMADVGYKFSSTINLVSKDLPLLNETLDKMIGMSIVSSYYRSKNFSHGLKTFLFHSIVNSSEFLEKIECSSKGHGEHVFVKILFHISESKNSFEYEIYFDLFPTSKEMMVAAYAGEKTKKIIDKWTHLMEEDLNMQESILKARMTPSELDI